MKKRLFCLLMVLTLALLQTAFSVCVAGESAQDAGTWVCSRQPPVFTGVHIRYHPCLAILERM